MRLPTAFAGALLLAGATLLAVPAAAAAQDPVAPRRPTGAIAGFVMDSISGRTLADALVQVALGDDPSVAFTATTDPTGAFRIDSVPAGVYLAGFFHPRLDSLGLDAPAYRVTVGEGETPLVLAIPSPTTIAVASCGLTPADSTGLVFGRVREADGGAPMAGATVTVQWAELVMDQRGLRQERRQLTATSDETGRYALCGIPTDGPVQTRAELGDDVTGSVELAVPPRSLVYRELLVPRGGAATPVAGEPALAGAPPAAPGEMVRRGTARLAGAVRHPDGSPFDNARVTVHGTLASDTTGADGRFRLDALPAGTHTLEVRAIGYNPTRVVVDLASGRTDTASVIVADRVPTLDAVTVYGTPSRSRGRMQEFLDRQKGGFGRFLTAEDIEKRNAFDTNDLFRMIPGVRVAYTGPFGGTLVMSGGRNECRPVVFLDGMRLFDGASSLAAMVQPHQIAGVEVYTHASSVPPQFYSGGCGAVVVWTKGVL